MSLSIFQKITLCKAHINISGAGIIKNSKNKENAIKFLEFLVSNEAQNLCRSKNFEYPIRKNIELNRFMKKYNNFIKDDINLSDLANSIKVHNVNGYCWMAIVVVIFMNVNFFYIKLKKLQSFFISQSLLTVVESFLDFENIFLIYPYDMRKSEDTYMDLLFDNKS